MADPKLLEEVGKYIDKYYEPARDDINWIRKFFLFLTRSAIFGREELRRKKQQKMHRHCRIWMKQM